MMTWLSFFIGVLVGWIGEWFIDLFYWRRAYQSCQAEKEALESRLDEVERRLARLQVDEWELEKAPQRVPSAQVVAEEAALVPPDVNLDADLKTADIALPSAEVDVDLEAPEVTLPDADLGINLEAPSEEVADTGIDDFLEGLKARFPDVDVEGSIDRLKARFLNLDLETALEGLKIDFPDLDIDGAVEGLQAKFPHLGADAAIGGVAEELGGRHAELPTMAPQWPDDLKLIEGIGPKISTLLNDHGILTFAQLADTSIDRLQAILLAGGPNYQLADPATWPEQAHLAADGAWDELRALQDRLTGGRQARRQYR